MLDYRDQSDGMQDLNLLILNGDLPIFPGWGGIEYLHTTHLTHYARKVGLVSLVHTYDQQRREQCLAEAGVALYLWENPAMASSPPQDTRRAPFYRSVGKDWYQAIRIGLGRPQDTLVEDLQFRNFAGPLTQALKDDSWHALIIVQSKSARWIDYVPKSPASVLVLHDIRALIYERQIQSAPWHKRVGLWLESQRYRHFENEYCKKFDLVITVSPADEAWVRKYYQARRLVTIPIPVDGNYFMPMSGVREAPARIIFTGMMNHPPNVDAACFFAREVLPRIQAVVPEAEFWIVGRAPTAQVRELIGVPGVVVTGSVPDIRPYMAQSAVFVVPLRFGSGVRQKILEAWAMQKCVVSTRIGAEGLDYRDGENILVADNAETMAQRVIDALRDRALRDRVRSGGREIVTVQHRPATLAQRYYDAIATVVHEKRKRSGPMQAVVDLRWMHPGVAGGIENLSRSFLDELMNLDQFNAYTILAPSEIVWDFDRRGQDNFHIQASDGLRRDGEKLRWRAERFLHRRLRMDYWRSPQVEQLRSANSISAEVALSLSGYIVTDLFPFPNLVVFPDLQHEYYPEFFSPEMLEERRRVFNGSAIQADHIIAISEHTRQSLLDRLGIDPDRVTTAHLAADARFQPENWRDSDLPRVQQKYKLPQGEYLFFPANTWPHKNHRKAFEALAILRATYRLAPLLVFSGAQKDSHPALVNLMRQLDLEQQVRYLGYCPADDLPALYRGAAALFYPSLFEGFGIPLVEAMWCRCPIVCSNTTSLPEIAGDAALLVDPTSAEALAEALARLLTDTGLRNSLIERGTRRVPQFSWRNFTLETVRLMQQVRNLR
jgi:glycosyltransferase involved in cell wall biosynthesis